jgi:hypothetical protein
VKKILVSEGTSGSGKAWSPKEFLQQVLQLALSENVRLIGMESTAYQYTALFWFQEMLDALGIQGIHLVEIKTAGLNKNQRILNLMQELLKGEIYLHPDIRSLVLNQLLRFNPTSRTNEDDIVDSLTFFKIILDSHRQLAQMDYEGILLAEEDYWEVGYANCEF